FIIMSALSAIDIALWDLSGKIAGIPVWQLLGGKCRDRIRTYGHAHGDTPDSLAENSVEKVKKYGFSAIKCFPLSSEGSYWGTEENILPQWSISLRNAEKRMLAIRDALGNDVDIAVDFHASIFNPANAIEAAEISKPIRPLFVEEPVRADNIDALAQVVQSVNVPIATGEMLYNKWQFRELLVKKAAHIVQPDVCIAGGLLECKKISAMAESFQVTVAPHNPMGPVATAANVHLCAAIPNMLILEYIPDDTPERCDIVDKPVKFSDGWLEIPDKPGLGIELNKEGLEKHPPEYWHRTFKYYPDGSAAWI
ncbi:MAG: mandelate racemase/muconate lactonizing enzyme family protein, partial [Candidatus Latescibacteria bacterium]|nr:mandelate racemase/muconate lactonizing enzyme family protein [Candidatus Latescibacterota bacterium]